MVAYPPRPPKKKKGGRGAKPTPSADDDSNGDEDGGSDEEGCLAIDRPVPVATLGLGYPSAGQPRQTRLAALMGWDEEEEEEGEDEERGDSEGEHGGSSEEVEANLVAAAAEVAAARQRARATTSRASGDERDMRLLDRQFDRLMAEYGDDEIGELDQDDPDLQARTSYSSRGVACMQRVHGR
eukprot:scaffold71750_cov30-Tisochrysis_lutea.AAC.6